MPTLLCWACAGHGDSEISEMWSLAQISYELKVEPKRKMHNYSSVEQRGHRGTPKSAKMVRGLAAGQLRNTTESGQHLSQGESAV